MSMVSWLRRRVSSELSSRRRREHSSKTHRPAFIQLEDRLVPATSVTASVVDPPATFLEGVAVNLTNTVQGAVGSLTYAWTVTKDGAAFANGAAADFSFTPDDNGAYAISLTVTDAGDASVVSDNSIVIAAENQAPVAGVSGPTTGAFGASLAFTLTATDAAADEAAGFTYNIDWNNDGTADETVAASANNGAGVVVNHTFAQPGVNTFSVTATDKDGGVSAPVTHTVTQTNGAAVVDGVLYVAGTAGADTILLIPKGRPTAQNAKVKVLLNGTNLGVFSGVNSINIVGLEGNDFIHLAGAIRVAATIDGGAGNDRIKSGKGNDLLIGGEGDDWLNGQQGKDVIIGGNGADRLLGGPGDDLLIAGTTAYDADADALAALLAVWAGPGSYGDHIAALMNAGATIHLITDGTSPTVQDDGAADRLTGAAGKDWFLASVPQDAVTGRLGAEFLNGAKGAAHGHQNGNGGHGHGH